MVCLKCTFNITRDMKNSVEISTVLGLFKEILINLVILTAQKMQVTFWKYQDKENSVVIVSRIIHFQVVWTTGCHKLIPILKTTLKSFCYCHVSWDTLYSPSNTARRKKLITQNLFFLLVS